MKIADLLEAKVEKTYTITKTRSGDRKNSISGTLAELVDSFSYTLETGASYQHEKGNKKINRKPANIKSLVDNLNAAVNNSAANGYANVDFTFVEGGESKSDKLTSTVSESAIDSLEKFAGVKIKPGRNVINGYPVDIPDQDADGLTMTAVDKDACTGLLKALRAAGLKASRDGDTSLVLEAGE